MNDLPEEIFYKIKDYVDDLILVENHKNKLKKITQELNYYSLNSILEEYIENSNLMNDINTIQEGLVILNNHKETINSFLHYYYFNRFRNKLKNKIMNNLMNNIKIMYMIVEIELLD